MHRRKPFSGKEKKKQLQERRSRKKDGPAYLRDIDSDNDDIVEESVASVDITMSATAGSQLQSQTQCRHKKVEESNLQVQKINMQPGKRPQDSKLDANSFRLHFFRESEETMKRKKKEAMKPIRPVSQSYMEFKLEDAYPESANLDFPKRPPWSYHLSKDQLDHQEQQYFEQYISEVISQPRSQDLSFVELNLETWRQLWRVLEISDVLLLIADIRYPALHLPPSLIRYLLQDLQKSLIIVLNKVDFVSPILALAWKNYLQAAFTGIHVIFFSSFPRQLHSENDGHLLVDFDSSQNVYKRPFQANVLPVGPTELLKSCKDIVGEKVDLSSWQQKMTEDFDVKAEILTPSFSQTTCDAVEAKSCRATESETPPYQQSNSILPCHQQSGEIQYKDGILTLGCIGYPNAGKSSLLNALVGKKVVSVSKTPGHTKHFQTIFLTPTVKLCDCPGLVFPSMVSKSLQVIAGIFPVAQVREPLSVVGYLAKRLDLPKLLNVQPPNTTPKKRDKSSGKFLWSPYDICEAWAMKNGFTTSKAGRPDVFRAANKILRLAVEGQILLCFYPPRFQQTQGELSCRAEAEKVAELISRKGQTEDATSICELADENSEESEDDGGERMERAEFVESMLDEDETFVKMRQAFQFLPVDETSTPLEDEIDET